MKRPTDKRISTDSSNQPGLNRAFDALPIDPLPNDLPTASAITAEPIWKLGRVILRRETAHRGGKTVIVIHDFATHLPASVIERVAKKLRGACGCGGSVIDRRIEMQGDQPTKIRALLEAEGFQVAGTR